MMPLSPFDPPFRPEPRRPMPIVQDDDIATLADWLKTIAVFAFVVAVMVGCFAFDVRWQS